MTLLRAISLCLLAALPFIAQTPPQPTGVVNSSVSGTVKDKGTGTPLPNYQVSTNATAPGAAGPPRRITAVTDQSGHYKLNDIPPGPHTIGVNSNGNGPMGTASRSLTLTGGDLENIDFHVVEFGTIAGKVIDENKDPMPGLTVYLVSKEYYLGSLGYYFKGISRSNSRGEYSLSRVEPGHTYYILTEGRTTSFSARSDSPLDPALRKQIPMRTWYPNSPSREGAAPVVVRAAEQRDGVDIELKKAPAYCISGIMSTPNGPGALTFEIEALQPSAGMANGVGVGGGQQKATTARDGQFRVCDLYPGSYSLIARELGSGPGRAGVPPSLGVAVYSFSIADQDLTDLKISTSPNLSLEAEVVLDGPQPQTPITSQINLSIFPVRDTSQPGEGLSGRVDIPGNISSSGLRPDDYAVQAFLNAPGLYIKSVDYAGRNVQYETLRTGSAMSGVGVRVTVGQDGATFTALVTDKDGNPVADTSVFSMPASAKSEAELASRIARGSTDQNGQYTSGTLAPGKYYLVATDDPLDYTPETIDKMFQSHARYKEIELAPNGSVQVALQPASIR